MESISDIRKLFRVFAAELLNGKSSTHDREHQPMLRMRDVVLLIGVLLVIWRFAISRFRVKRNLA